MLAESAALKGKTIAALLLDLRKFFEKIPLEELRKRALRAGVPEWLVETCLAMYSAARVLMLQGVVWRKPLFALNGIPAGCSLADVWITVFSAPPLETFARLMPAISLKVWFDDFCLTITAESGDALAWKLALAVVVLRWVVRERMCAAFAADKTECVSNSAAAVKTAATLLDKAKLGLKTFLPKPAACAPNLGIDHALGAFRKLGVKSVRKKRGMKMRERGKHIQGCRALMNSQRGRMHRIETTGLVPAMAYGARVWGMALPELRRARAHAMASAPPSAQASLSAK